MRKTGILLIVVLLAVAAYAAVEVTITVPTEHAAKVLTAFNVLAGKKLHLEAENDPNDPNEYIAGWYFEVQPKDPNETNKQFAERFTKQLVRASVRMVDKAADSKRYWDAVKAVPMPDVNIPDEIIE